MNGEPRGGVERGEGGPDFSEHEPEVKSHVERDIKTLCAYCGTQFEIDENVIEKEIHGRTWRFCNDRCLHNFLDAYDFHDPEDSEEEGDTCIRFSGEEE